MCSPREAGPSVPDRFSLNPLRIRAKLLGSAPGRILQGFPCLRRFSRSGLGTQYRRSSERVGKKPGPDLSLVDKVPVEGAGARLGRTSGPARAGAGDTDAPGNEQAGAGDRAGHAIEGAEGIRSFRNREQGESVAQGEG